MSDGGIRQVKIRPYGKRILVLPDELKTVTAGGVLVPESETVKPMCGTVVAIGDVSIEVGWKVFYPRYTGAEVEEDGRKYIIIEEQDILGVQ
jgi:chaperonin GroES